MIKLLYINKINESLFSDVRKHKINIDTKFILLVFYFSKNNKIINYSYCIFWKRNKKDTNSYIFIIFLN